MPFFYYLFGCLSVQNLAATACRLRVVTVGLFCCQVGLNGDYFRVEVDVCPEIKPEDIYHTFWTLKLGTSSLVSVGLLFDLVLATSISRVVSSKHENF